MLQAAATTTMPATALAAISCAPSYTDRSNAIKGMKRYAARASRPVTDYEITGAAPSYSFRLKISDGIPVFLDRTQGKTKEEIDALRAKMNARDRRTTLKNPPGERRLKTPKGGKVTGLGMSPLELHAAGAKSSAEKAGTGKRVKLLKKMGKSVGAKPAKPAKSGAGSSKGEMVVKMLKARWTPMADIMKETGWLGHTARAFISRLRTVDKMAVEHDKAKGYRIA